ncbi:MAG: DUF2971 domain-containing protein [Rhodospirillales bacterium]|nr:DUF2971 domain-containing protein [Rhodospirillales bacterium]
MKLQNTRNMDGQKLIWDEHPELWHYTTKCGLKGILRSRQLWATNFRSLNDTSEVRHLMPYLKPYYLPHMKRKHGEVYEHNEDFGSSVINMGGIDKSAEHDADAILNSQYDRTFCWMEEDGPFFTSFCSHARADEWTRQHGLLSQWRAYANGGYAIVLNTKGLWQLLEQECKMYEYWIAGLEKVVYEDDTPDFESHWPDLIRIIPDALCEFFRNAGESPNLDKLHKFFARAACTFKHQAFREESEVRIVIMPLCRDEVPEQRRISTRSFKDVHRRCENILYIKLFDGIDNMRLPIERIVVGPHSRQGDLRADAHSLVAELGYDFSVECSHTPYIGPKEKQLR